VTEEGDAFGLVFRTGEPAVGEFRCSGCRYGVSVHRSLPQCPMCGGTAWELTASLSASRQSLTAARTEQPVA
jgi:hypothetical protein